MDGTLALTSLYAHMAHAFVGVMLVSVVILLLDPAASSPGAGLNAGNLPIHAGRLAGRYSLVLCGCMVIMTFAIRGRYIRRT